MTDGPIKNGDLRKEAFVNPEGMLRNYVQKLEKLKSKKYSPEDSGRHNRSCMICGTKKKLHTMSRLYGLIEVICTDCLPYLPSKEDIEKASPGLMTRPYRITLTN